MHLNKAARDKALLKSDALPRDLLLIVAEYVGTAEKEWVPLAEIWIYPFFEYSDGEYRMVQDPPVVTLEITHRESTEIKVLLIASQIDQIVKVPVHIPLLWKSEASCWRLDSIIKIIPSSKKDNYPCRPYFRETIRRGDEFDGNLYYFCEKETIRAASFPRYSYSVSTKLHFEQHQVIWPLTPEVLQRLGENNRLMEKFEANMDGVHDLLEREEARPNVPPARCCVIM